MCVAFAAAVWTLCPRRGEILPGVRVAGLPIGGMSPAAARPRLQQHFSTVATRKVLLVDGERCWETTPGDLGCGLDLESTLQRAYAVGRTGSRARRLRESWQARREGLALKPTRVVDRLVLRKRLKALAAQARIPARDARILFDGAAFVVTPERVGRWIDAEQTEKNIVRYFDPLTHRRVTLVAADERPRVTAAELRQIDARLASYTTRFNPAD
ncbi:MAG: peptidoglycan binding domain-containing protein, partial [Armatimonadota bacterium]|nr:peptidoglycan binding domain-containing protein [Armatimonadota bacterium]